MKNGLKLASQTVCETGMPVMLCAYPFEIEGVLDGIAHLASPADVRHEDVDDSRVIIIFGLHGTGLVIALIEIYYDIAPAHG